MKLAVRGIPSEDLRKKYGHDLDALLCRSRRRKLGREVKLKANDLSAIDVLNSPDRIVVRGQAS